MSCGTKLTAWEGNAYYGLDTSQSTIDSEGFKGGTRGAPIMPRDAVSRTANVERTGRHKSSILDVFYDGYILL